MNRSVYEGRFLVNMIDTVIRKDAVYPMHRRMDWERLFRLSDYHGIANAVYIASFGAGESIPEQWGERLFGRYGESVRYSSLYESSEIEILDTLNRRKCPAVILESAAVRRLYPIPEAAADAPLRLYFESMEAWHLAKGYLVDLGYLTDEEYKGFGEHMHRPNGFNVVMYYALPFITKGYRKNMSALMERAYQDRTYQQLKELSLESSYVYLIAESCYKYCTDSLRIRGLLDIYLFYRTFHERMNQRFVDARLKEFGITDLAEGLLHIADVWFGAKGEKLFPFAADNNTMVYDILESRILTNGAVGDDTIPGALKLRREIVDEMNRETRAERAARRRMQIREFFRAIVREFRWVFPGFRYMASMYPILEKIPVLLPYFWIVRGIHLFFISVHTEKEDYASARTSGGTAVGQAVLDEEMSDESRNAAAVRTILENQKKKKKVYRSSTPTVEYAGRKSVSGNVPGSSADSEQEGAPVSSEEQAASPQPESKELSTYSGTEEAYPSVEGAASTAVSPELMKRIREELPEKPEDLSADKSFNEQEVEEDEDSYEPEEPEAMTWEFPRITLDQANPITYGSTRRADAAQENAPVKEQESVQSDGEASRNSRSRSGADRGEMDSRASSASERRSSGNSLTAEELASNIHANSGEELISAVFQDLGNREEDTVHSHVHSRVVSDTPESGTATVDGHEVNYNKWRFPTIEDLEDREG